MANTMRSAAGGEHREPRPAGCPTIIGRRSRAHRGAAQCSWLHAEGWAAKDWLVSRIGEIIEGNQPKGAATSI